MPFGYFFIRKFINFCVVRPLTGEPTALTWYIDNKILVHGTKSCVFTQFSILLTIKNGALCSKEPPFSPD
jgi:hypothetical protein